MLKRKPPSSNTCLNHADFDKANTSILTALSHHEALTVCRFTQMRLANTLRAQVRNPSALLHQLLTASREEARRTLQQRDRAPPPGGALPYNSQGNTGSGPAGGAYGNNGNKPVVCPRP